MAGSRFNAVVTDALVAGAVDCLLAHGVAPSEVSVVRVEGALELPQLVSRLLRQATASGAPFAGAVAVGAVIRGETPHFDYVCSTTFQGLMELGLATGTPVGFGVLTCDSLEQALARAGGARGNKGAEAAAAALDLAAAASRAGATWA